jgi:hypothetical protein
MGDELSRSRKSEGYIDPSREDVLNVFQDEYHSGRGHRRVHDNQFLLHDGMFLYSTLEAGGCPGILKVLPRQTVDHTVL